MSKIVIFSTIILLTLSGCISFYHDDRKKGIGVEIGSAHDVFFGSVQLQDTSYPNLVINGKAKFDNVSITETLIINGALSATKSKIGTMLVNGKADLQQTTITGISTINGYVHAQDSIFLDRISVRSKRITLSGSTIKAITVKKPSKSEPVEQIIELRNTKIDGNILFEGGNGKVLLKGNSKIIGKIDGGVIEKF